MNFKGIPQFSPELFKYVVNADPLKTKQLNKGLEQLTDEGVAQLFTKKTDNRKVLGTVGALQFEVIQHRLKSEYSASCNFEHISLFKACWISSKNKKKLEEFIFEKLHHMATDKEGRPVFLAESAWALQMAQEKNPDIHFCLEGYNKTKVIPRIHFIGAFPFLKKRTGRAFRFNLFVKNKKDLRCNP